MSRHRHYSLTLRLALIFALLAFALLATLGVTLYHELERELIKRDDAALISRVNQLRNLLNDGNTLELIKTKPELFQNMMGNSESVLSIAAPGHTPLLLVNPGNIQIPSVSPVAKDHALELSDVHHFPDVNGLPFAAVAASIDTGDLGSLQVTVGRLMAERTAMLASYRLSVFILASIAAIILALVGYVLVHRGLLPLRRLASHAQGIGVSNLAERLDSQGAPKELLPMIDSFNTMLERLAKGFDQLGQVSTDMAHELRTPINNLLGETQVALQQSRSMESYQQLLASNVEELERLARMLDNMLFLARTDPASALRQRQALSAAEEVERMADYFEGLASDVGMHILAEGQGVIWAEPMLLRRALANLCANAIKYGAPNTQLSIQAIPTAEGIRLRVSNHGETIAGEHLPRLFERFYRVDESRECSSQSNGLGLSIVATIMQLHNGRYGVSSEDSVTCFELFFPRREAEGRRPEPWCYFAKNCMPLSAETPSTLFSQTLTHIVQDRCQLWRKTVSVWPREHAERAGSRQRRWRQCGSSGMEKRLGLLEKRLADMKEKLFAVSSRADSMEKHFATKADLATTELNLIKWYVATAFAMTGLACAITFGLTRLLTS